MHQKRRDVKGFDSEYLLKQLTYRCILWQNVFNVKFHNHISHLAFPIVHMRIKFANGFPILGRKKKIFLCEKMALTTIENQVEGQIGKHYSNGFESRNNKTLDE